MKQNEKLENEQTTEENYGVQEIISARWADN